MEKLDFDLPVFIPVHHHLSPRHFRVRGRNVMHVAIKNLLLWEDRAVLGSEVCH